MEFPCANDAAPNTFSATFGQQAVKPPGPKRDLASVKAISNPPLHLTGQSLAYSDIEHAGRLIERPSKMRSAQGGQAPDKLNEQAAINLLSLPREILCKILGHLDLADLHAVSLLRHDLRQLALSTVKFSNAENLNDQLFYQVPLGNTAAIQFCHDAGINLIDIREPGHGRTLFMEAIRFGQIAIIEMLMNLSAANLQVLDKSNRNALHHAVLKENFDIVKRIIELPGLDVNAADHEGATPLHYAACQNKCGIVNMIIRQQLCLKPNEQATPATVVNMDQAGQLSETQGGKTASRIGLIDVNAADEIGFTALHYAIFLARTDFLEHLLAIENINVNARDINGATVLHYAAERNSTKWLKSLLAAEGIELNIRQSSGCTPLYLAVAKNRSETVALLLNQAAIMPNIPDAMGLTPLHRAVADEYSTAVELLLARQDTEVNAIQAEGWTPLHFAALFGHSAIAERLINQRARINIRQDDGWTPLHCAVMHGHQGIVERLLFETDIDLDVKDNSQRVPADYAALHGRDAMAKLLLDTASARRKS